MNKGYPNEASPSSSNDRSTSSRSSNAGRRNRRRFKALDYIRITVVLVVVVITCIPVVWILLSSLKRPGECLRNPPVWVPPIPQWSNFPQMWADGGSSALFNSLVVTLGGTFVAVVLGVTIAYSVSRFRTGGPRLVNWVLSVKFLPAIAFAIPIADMFRTLNLIDTHFGLILVYGAFNLPFVVWTMKGFMDEVPRQLDESALMDGCSRVGVLWKIVFPLTAPGLVSTTLLTFIFIWSEFLFALVLGQHVLFTVPVRLSQYYSDAEGWRCAPQAALATVAIIPMIAMALFGQRYIIRAMTYGAVKE